MNESENIIYMSFISYEYPQKPNSTFFSLTNKFIALLKWIFYAQLHFFFVSTNLTPLSVCFHFFFSIFSSQSNSRIDKKKYLKQGMVPPQNKPHPQTTLFLKRERARFCICSFSSFCSLVHSLAFVSDRYIFIVCCFLVSSRWLTFRVCIQPQSVDFRIVVSEQHLLRGFLYFIQWNIQIDCVGIPWLQIVVVRKQLEIRNWKKRHE